VFQHGDRGHRLYTQLRRVCFSPRQCLLQRAQAPVGTKRWVRTPACASLSCATRKPWHAPSLRRPYGSPASSGSCPRSPTQTRASALLAQYQARAISRSLLGMKKREVELQQQGVGRDRAAQGNQGPGY
jgi:hypothetical protein